MKYRGMNHLPIQEDHTLISGLKKSISRHLNIYELNHKRQKGKIKASHCRSCYKERTESSIAYMQDQGEYRNYKPKRNAKKIITTNITIKSN